MDLTEEEVTTLLEKEPFDAVIWDITNPNHRMFIRARHLFEQLVANNDESIQKVPPGSYVVVHPERGIVKHSHSKREVGKQRKPFEYIFSYQTMPRGAKVATGLQIGHSDSISTKTRQYEGQHQQHLIKEELHRSLTRETHNQDTLSFISE
eukprot:TRINITY_DN3558_c0_g1_i2.p1 TRINITY_DN3558_c0_g1~~TRINITY_DN3558_c0_g1_i2.p1  ORF type:complete len:151 (-),score=3.86 TRINITY_DN3558_c0_g1_i2:482-934(-)